jgi:murein DD-endopeptidase MepM/ murein hydrolase activator NlpD
MSAETDYNVLHRAEALHRLADALSVDIIDTPAERLFSEVAEDLGDRRAMAKEFDHLLGRTVGQPRWQQILEWSREFIATAVSGMAWRPVLASIGTILIVLVAGDLYVHLRPAEPVQQVASAPEAAPSSPTSQASLPSPTLSSGGLFDERSISQRSALRDEQSDAFRSSVAQPAPEASFAAPTSDSAGQPSTAAYDNPKSVRTLPVGPNQPPLGAREASVSRSAPALAASPQNPSAAVAKRQELTESQVASGNADPMPAPGKPAAVAPTTAAPAPSNATSHVFSWPVRGRIIARFGPIPGGEQSNGISVAVPEGTDIRAAEDGLVVYAGGEVKGYGNLVLVRHRDDFVTAYANASQILVGKGDVVRRGQVIAKSGRTGNVAEPQVHFEIRRGTVPVDPAQYLSPG